MIHGVEIKCAAAPGVRQANQAHAISLGLPVLSGRQPARIGRVAIVGTGPSAQDDLAEILQFDGEVWACNGALNWLADRGRIADCAVYVDFQKELAEYLRCPPRETHYLVSSSCAPEVFDALKDRDVMLFFSADWDNLPPSGSYTVGGGPTVITRAPYVAWCLGFREIHLYGADSSYTDRRHVDGHGDVSVTECESGMIRVPERFFVPGSERVFVTHTSLLGQASFLATMADSFPANLVIHGNGLGPSFARAQPDYDLTTRLMAR